MPAPRFPPASRGPSCHAGAALAAAHDPGFRPSLAQRGAGQAQKRFQEADLDTSGSLTREEARRAGLGFVDNNFDEIDTAGRGKVSFDDVRKFMAQRGK
ncbi:EF-hand domain-containing protein [Massilia sp. H-1]|nr:EF-hand domain-containing protein [Massilia sp. H-1]